MKKEKSLKKEGGSISPTSFFPGELPPDATPAALPARIQKKITVDEQSGCWEWTGSVTAHRSRYKAYPVPIDYKGHRNFSGCHQDERAVPMVSQSEMRGPSGRGYPVSAVRYVYARLTGLNYERVPTLMRCPNDLCVSPYHVHCKDIPPKQKRALSQARLCDELQFLTESQNASAPTAKTENLQEYALDALKKFRPDEGWPFSGINLIEDECSLDRGSISVETWAAYVAWSMENPEDD